MIYNIFNSSETINQDTLQSPVHGFPGNIPGQGLVSMLPQVPNYQYGAGQDTLNAPVALRNLPSSGKVYSTVYTYTGTSTGAWSYTGVGFQPKVVRIQANLIDSLGGSSDGTSTLTDDGCQYDYWSSGTFIRSYRNNRLVYIPNNGNTTLKAATLTSMDADGFTLNFTSNNTPNAQFIITCWG